MGSLLKSRGVVVGLAVLALLTAPGAAGAGRADHLAGGGQRRPLASDVAGWPLGGEVLMVVGDSFPSTTHPVNGNGDAEPGRADDKLDDACDHGNPARIMYYGDGLKEPGPVDGGKGKNCERGLPVTVTASQVGVAEAPGPSSSAGVGVSCLVGTGLGLLLSFMGWVWA